MYGEPTQFVDGCNSSKHCSYSPIPISSTSLAQYSKNTVATHTSLNTNMVALFKYQNHLMSSLPMAFLRDSIR